MVEITPGKDARLSISGRTASQSLRYGTDMVIWTKRESPAVRLDRSELVFAGYGIVAPEFNWNDYAGLDVRGKTVLVLMGDPGTGGRDPAVFKGGALSYYGRWAYKIAEAARQGAAAVLLIHDAETLGYGWSAVVNTWTAPQLELAVSDSHAGGLAIEGWLTGAAGRALFAAAGLDYGNLAHAAARPGFKAIAMGLKVDGEVDGTVRRFDSANVIALLPGGERKHEYVVYCAHWDGLGRDSSGAVIDAAEDNATGVAGLMTLAQSFSRTHPRSESLDRVHRLHRRRVGAARLTLLRRSSRAVARTDQRRPQSRPPAHRRPHARCDGVRRRQFRTRGIGARGRASAGTRVARGPASGARKLLRLRSAELRVARRSRAVRQIGNRRRGPRPAVGRGAARGLSRASLSPGRPTSTPRIGMCAARSRTWSCIGRSASASRTRAASRAGIRTASSAAIERTPLPRGLAGAQPSASACRRVPSACGGRSCRRCCRDRSPRPERRCAIPCGCGSVSASASG